MHCFRILHQHARFVLDDLGQTRSRHDPERLVEAGSGSKLDLSSLNRRGRPAVEERISSLRLALERQSRRNGPAQFTGDPKQFGRRTVFELELEFSDRFRSSTRVDRTAVDSEFDRGCFGRNRIDRAADFGLEQRFERATQFLAGQRLERSATDRLPIRPLAADLGFGLAAIEQSGTLQPLDGLHPPLSDAPNPQGYAMRAQLPVRGIEVEGLELLDPSASGYFSSDQARDAC